MRHGDSKYAFVLAKFEQVEETRRIRIEPSCFESVGIYEYSTKDLIGHGAFAVVYRGRLKMVS